VTSADDSDAGIGEQADALLDRISPILAGQPAEVQGAVIADLAAMWLAGHRDARGRAAGDRFRDRLLHLHAEHVRDLARMYLEDVDG
jgi:hypothetical protein